MVRVHWKSGNLCSWMGKLSPYALVEINKVEHNCSWPMIGGRGMGHSIMYSISPDGLTPQLCCLVATCCMWVANALAAQFLTFLYKLLCTRTPLCSHTWNRVMQSRWHNLVGHLWVVELIASTSGPVSSKTVQSDQEYSSVGNESTARITSTGNGVTMEGHGENEFRIMKVERVDESVKLLLVWRKWERVRGGQPCYVDV